MLYNKRDSTMTIKNLTKTQQQESKRLPLRFQFLSNRMSKGLFTGILALGLITTTTVNASDHLDEGVFNLAHDLSDFYAFTSPENHGNVVFVLNYHPKAKKNATLFSGATWFSQEHKFVVALREAKIEASGAKTAFTLGDTEYHFSCVFAMLTEDDEQVVQTGNCVAPSGESLSVNVNDKHGNQGDTFKVFAGLRSDPFFMAARKIVKNFKSNSTNYPNPGSNDVAGHNVLSIVLEANIQANFSTVGTTLFAVRSEVLNQDAQPKRLDSIGRPEVTNMVIGVPCLTFLMFNKSICKEFNQQDTFVKERENKNEFISQINVNLKRWDDMDGQVDWPFVGGNHPLSELVYADYLIMDFAKPFDESGFFGIENSLLAEKQHTTSGGRWLNEDVVDKLLTMYISRARKHYSDFVNEPTKPAKKSFPYVRSPN